VWAGSLVGLPVVIERFSAMATHASISASARAKQTILFMESVSPFKLVGYIHVPSNYIVSNDCLSVYIYFINSNFCLKGSAFFRIFVINTVKSAPLAVKNGPIPRRRGCDCP
jgi:hypothetical protein